MMINKIFRTFEEQGYTPPASGCFWDFCSRGTREKGKGFVGLQLAVCLLAFFSWLRGQDGGLSVLVTLLGRLYDYYCYCHCL